MNEFPIRLPATDLGHAQIIFRLVLAMVMGGLLGIDREVRSRSAGIRTHMLVALAASLFTLVTLEIVASMKNESGSGGDPVRVIEAITAGVAFLAAGSIIRAGGKVEGLTTGAGLWLAGAVGLACGLGLWSVAAAAVLLGLFILAVLDFGMRMLGVKGGDAPGNDT